MVRNGKNGKKDTEEMISSIIGLCDRIKRKNSITRRLRHRRIVSGHLIHLQKMEVELENLLMNDEQAIRENIWLIRMFYDELRDARTCVLEFRYPEAKIARKSARTALVCIDRNIKATARFAGVQYVIN